MFLVECFRQCEYLCYTIHIIRQHYLPIWMIQDMPQPAYWTVSHSAIPQPLLLGSYSKQFLKHFLLLPIPCVTEYTMSRLLPVSFFGKGQFLTTCSDDAQRQVFLVLCAMLLHLRYIWGFFIGSWISTNHILPCTCTIDNTYPLVSITSGTTADLRLCSVGRPNHSIALSLISK
jgi:hypothetical protein